MKTTQHTPGPWTYYGDDMVAKNGELIAQALRGGSRQLPIQSNRALIAAAPELLAEAQAELHWIENLIGDIRAGRPLKPARIEEGLILRRDSLRETIAKAKCQ